MTSNGGAPPRPPIPRELDTSLDPKETTPGKHHDADLGLTAPLETPEHTFRHGGWTNTRTLVHHALRRIYQTGDRSDRFARCGSNAWVFTDPQNPDTYVVKATYCHDRWCKPCQAHRSHLIRANIHDHAQGRNLRFITLTVQHAGRTLGQGVTHLLRSFARLRQSPLWKARTRGGIALLEVKRSRKTAQWHPHLHCVVEGGFMAQSALSSTWKAITKDSIIVDIRQVNQLADLTKYITKYITKPASPSVYGNVDDLQEAILALHGRRSLITFGTWYGVNFLRSDSTIAWIAVDSLDRIIDQAHRGDVAAQAIIAKLRKDQQCQANTERAPPGMDSSASTSSPIAPRADARCTLTPGLF